MNAANFSAIDVRTCQERAENGAPHLVAPGDREPTSLFRVQDPFGLRRAITPLFWMDSDGDLIGYGSAFAVDPWGTFATADHVISDFRRVVGNTSRQATNAGPDTVHCDMPTNAGFVTVLGVGLIFGTVGLPAEALLRMAESWTPALRGSDPMAALQGRTDLKPLDFSVLTMRPRPQTSMIGNLPMRSRPSGLQVGDLVVAVGYPEIQTFKGSAEDARTAISEGMFASYATVTAVYPTGREADLGNPVFQVDTYWPSGMSGGPVLNMQGEVVGVVSRSLAPGGDEEPGVSYATWLEQFSDLERWMPTLDPDNPCWRKGWAVRRSEPWTMSGVFPDKAEADATCENAGRDFEVVFGSWRLGTDDFVSTTAD